VWPVAPKEDAMSDMPAGSTSKLAVVAVGGNSLIADDKHRTVADQYNAAAETSRHIVDMIEMGWQVVLTHGNGPQVGFILRRSELARHELHEVPLDACGADTQGAIGYMFQRALRNEINRRARAGRWPHAPIMPVTVVTQTLVDANDPAFSHPSKPIGSFMDEATARLRAEREGWQVVEDAGRGWRRVVPSPRPIAIIELDAIKALVREGFLVICSGGGGVPVKREPDGALTGLEAVIDKDLAGALLAAALRADLFMISTAVEKVAIHFRKPEQRWLDRLTVVEAERYLAEGHFHAGSMGPKIEAVLNFLRDRPGSSALITDPPNITRALRGETGTWIVARREEEI
jgi:carbamate kinase